MYGEEREEIAFSIQAVAGLYSGEVVPEENRDRWEKVYRRVSVLLLRDQMSRAADSICLNIAEIE